MQIVFKVDQAECFRRGIDAPHSTIRINVKPDDITEQQRVALADVLKNGYDASACSHSIPTPDIRGVQEMARKLVDAKVAARQEWLQGRQKEVRAAIAELAAVRDTPLYIKRDGKISMDQFVSTNVASVAISASNGLRAYTADYADHDYVSAELRAEFQSAWQDALAQREIAIADATPKLQALYEAQMERERVAQDEYQALYARLPATVRKRHESGYATDQEIRGMLVNLILTDEGYSVLGDIPPELRYMSHAANALTDAAFEALEKAKQAAPKDASVDARIVNLYRKADDSDDIDEIDSDGDVMVETRVYAFVEWTRGGIKVLATVMLESNEEKK